MWLGKLLQGNTRCLMIVEDFKMAKSENNFIKVVKKDHPVSFVFFTMYIGAAVYFVGNTDGFWNIILALLKAIVWPAFLINRVFELLKI